MNSTSLLPIEDVLELELDPWVERFVVPRLNVRGAKAEQLARPLWPERITEFLHGIEAPEFVADWHDDIRYLMQAITVKPGQVIALPDFTCKVTHVRSWPNSLENAIRHNALWDARALRDVLLNNVDNKRAVTG